MSINVSPFQLNGCRCKLKSDPVVLQTMLRDLLIKNLQKKSKVLDKLNGPINVTGKFTEIDQGNYALHLLLIFLGKAWIAGSYKVDVNGQTLVEKDFRLSGLFPWYVGIKGQLNGNIKNLATQITTATTKAAKSRPY